MTAAPRITTKTAAGRHAPPLPRKAGRMLAFALIRREPSGWLDLAEWLALALPITDRTSLAWAVLRSLPPDARTMTAEAAFWTGPGVVTGGGRKTGGAHG